MSCDGDEDDNKKIIITAGYIIQPCSGQSTATASCPPQLSPTIRDVLTSLGYILWLTCQSITRCTIMYIGTQYTLCGLWRRIVWKCIQRRPDRGYRQRRNIWALKVSLCTYPTCIYINFKTDVYDKWLYNDHIYTDSWTE